MGDNGLSIIVDNGSDTIKAGFANHQVPRAIIPTILPEEKDGFGKMREDDYRAFEKNLMKRDTSTLPCPIKNGIVNNWNDMEKLWNYTFQRLHFPVEDASILLTETPTNPKPDREKTAQIMFESFNFKAMYLSINSVLSMHGADRSTGFVVECGHDVTNVVSIFEGYAIPQITSRMDFAGRDLTEYLMKLINEDGTSFHGPESLEIIRNVKETLCYTALDFEKELEAANSSLSLERVQETPYGEIKISKQRFQCAEALFQPLLIENKTLETNGIHHLTCDSIMKCEPEIRKDMFANIILSGGSTMFPGFADRMKKEISALAPPSTEVNILAPSNRDYLAWLGGSKLVSDDSFNGRWFTKAEYEENGASYIHRKCI